MKSSAPASDMVQMPQHTSYWLIVGDGRHGMEVLTTRLPDGRRALPVFTFEEEARMFLCLRGDREGSREGLRVRRSAPGELLSVLYTLAGEVECVTLDPIPEVPHLEVSGLLSVGREEFMGRLERKVRGRYRSPGGGGLRDAAGA